MTDDAPTTADELVVRRSGGLAGVSRTGRIALDGDDRGRQARELLERVDLTAFAGGVPGRPDRFVYSIDAPGRSATVGETQLTGDLAALVRLALDPDGAAGPSAG
ncbi:hypothetical protein FHX74_003820 [Friedmanniella endophytica]|uniref:Uncharacterized protein n=1 Tax=Microlunatus kandeliicorticis TaxID=1759536 RepID=A0A7W3P7P6_9ACTN|nr:protealysin inhibitor emfourin [Microlunatus kandeliicorticis]MBA8796167.1 hypothetical protein [Microlunatus kandeliicorticis]